MPTGVTALYVLSPQLLNTVLGTVVVMRDKKPTEQTPEDEALYYGASDVYREFLKAFGRE